MSKQKQRKTCIFVCYLPIEQVKHNIIFNLSPVEYCFIQHSPEEDNKKTHIHVYLKFEDKIDFNKLANLFNISPNLIQVPENRNAYIRYMLHIGVDGKIKYTQEQLFTNIVNIEDIINIKNERLDYDSFIREINYFVKNSKECKHFGDLVNYLLLVSYGKYIVKHYYFLKNYYDFLTGKII